MDHRHGGGSGRSAKLGCRPSSPASTPRPGARGGREPLHPSAGSFGARDGCFHAHCRMSTVHAARVPGAVVPTLAKLQRAHRSAQACYPCYVVVVTLLLPALELANIRDPGVPYRLFGYHAVRRVVHRVPPRADSACPLDVPHHVLVQSGLMRLQVVAYSVLVEYVAQGPFRKCYFGPCSSAGFGPEQPCSSMGLDRDASVSRVPESLRRLPAEDRGVVAVPRGYRVQFAYGGRRPPLAGVRPCFDDRDHVFGRHPVRRPGEVLRGASPSRRYVERVAGQQFVRPREFAAQDLGCRQHDGRVMSTLLLCPQRAASTVPPPRRG